MIDDMDKETIALKKEVEYIQDYIKLQSIRSSVEHKIQMNVAIDCEEECMIAPMLLIPFVENAFKHGINPNKVSELLIDIKGQKDEIQFVIENNVDKKLKTFYKEKGFGIGIENVSKRLEYLYPEKHNISVANVENRFIVILSIKLNT
jgi:LytS/YehU family sensor histidine kinase